MSAMDDIHNSFFICAMKGEAYVGKSDLSL